MTATTLEQRYRELVEESLLGIYVSRPDGCLIACNAAFANMLGFASPADAVGRSMIAVSDDMTEREMLVRHVRDHGRLEHHRGSLRRLDGGRVEVIETAAGHFDGSGALTELRGFLLDVTATVEKSEKMESIGRLAGGIAHDFNNLLTAILGYTELLLSDRDSDDPGRPDLEEIQKAALRAAALTQQLVSFSRNQVLMAKAVDLNHTVANLQTMLGRLLREDIRLTTVLSPLPAIVRLDPTQIEQVIVNLVLNARDALPGGGDIRIEVAQVRRQSQELSPELPAGTADYIRLSVADNGVGFTAEARAHLFEPFYTTKEVGKGIGLGLASAYGFVRQSDGFMSVESEPGNGAIFTMHFPAVPTGPMAEPKLPSAGEPVFDRGTILLVEDEDAVRVIVGAVLRRSGYRVLEASTPRAACEMFDRHLRDIDLLVTDIVMPDMNGPALAQRLVGRRPDLRVLFISGYSDRGTPLDAETPNVSVLSKPFQPSVLSARVREMLEGPGSKAARATSGA